VPYEKQAVNEQAQRFAALNLNLWIDNRGYVLWNECFDALESTGGLIVTVHGDVAPVLGKRRAPNQDEAELSRQRRDRLDQVPEEEEEEL
jgi:hypothetical protein